MWWIPFAWSTFCGRQDIDLWMTILPWSNMSCVLSLFIYFQSSFYQPGSGMFSTELWEDSFGGSEDIWKMHLVNWDTVSTACYKGGLGIPNLGDMNAALIIKWIYRYENKNYQLWGKVVYAKSWADLNSLSIILSNRSRRSTLVSLLGSLLDRNNFVASIVSRRFRNLISDGMDFWSNNWTGRGELKDLFLGFSLLRWVNKNQCLLLVNEKMALGIGWFSCTEDL